MGLWDSSPAARTTTVRVCITGLNSVVGCLFLLRSSGIRHGSLGSILICIPSFVVCGWAFQAARRVEVWPLYAEGTFAAGTTLAIVSFLYLGRSFAILPAVGAIVNGGPYRFIRHPAYLGEFTMILACFLSNPRLGTLGSLALSIPAIVARIHTEEKLLASESSYQEYRQQVRWRLLPGLW